MQPGIARASYMNEQSESLAGILSGSYAAIFLDDMHGEEHTDEIDMHTVLYSLQRMSRRDARQPRPPWSSLTLRRRTSDERAAGRARVSESWRLSALRCRRRGVEMWGSLRWVRAVCSCGTAAPYGPARLAVPSALPRPVLRGRNFRPAPVSNGGHLVPSKGGVSTEGGPVRLIFGIVPLLPSRWGRSTPPR